jgi:hypothetical protein
MSDTPTAKEIARAIADENERRDPAARLAAGKSAMSGFIRGAAKDRIERTNSRVLGRLNQPAPKVDDD